MPFRTTRRFAPALAGAVLGGLLLLPVGAASAADADSLTAATGPQALPPSQAWALTYAYCAATYPADHLLPPSAWIRNCMRGD